ncbi:response regulator transcription factor [Methylobacterium sp. NEAU K]|uniref:response regulator transcription factor n=1 Tax=Methylobacterium sp. NEAU K TaxID=3064946 RepID=UPI002735C0AE|nr:response regulator transcription factor [Methylobacterium sp. NEAU K]MDP4002093.1 response regulator transcription factor [Methylobacterium sp. NEAU K]
MLIVDDHPVVLSGLRRLAEDAGVGTVYEASDIVSGYRTFHRYRPGLVVTDLSFRDQGLSGLSLIRRVRALEPATRILAFSMHDDPVIVARAIECGAHGFVLKDTAVARFHEALEAVGAGHSFLSHDLAMRIAVLNGGPKSSPLSRLTARELQILSLLGSGKTNAAIANSLSMSRRNVSTIVSGMKQKLGASSLAHLLHIAVTRDGAAPSRPGAESPVGSTGERPCRG